MLVENTGGAGAVSISPDGRFVAHAFQEKEGSVGIFLLNVGIIPAEGGALLHKIASPFGAGNLSWAPDGRAITYTLKRESASNVWYHPIDGGPAKQITHFADGDIFDCSWSKDGKQLAVTRGHIRSDVVRISNFRK